MEKKQTPTHFAISPEDYAEYQALKAKSIEKQIYYSRIKTGSKVMLNKSDLNLYGGQLGHHSKVDFDSFFYVLIPSGEYCMFNTEKKLEKRKGYNDTTFIQNGITLVYSYAGDYITEVIEY